MKFKNYKTYLNKANKKFKCLKVKYLKNSNKNMNNSNQI